MRAWKSWSDRSAVVRIRPLCLLGCQTRIACPYTALAFAGETGGGAGGDGWVAVGIRVGAVGGWIPAFAGMRGWGVAVRVLVRRRGVDSGPVSEYGTCFHGNEGVGGGGWRPWGCLWHSNSVPGLSIHLSSVLGHSRWRARLWTPAHRGLGRI